MEKTLVMKILDKANIAYTPHTLSTPSTDALEVAKILGEDPNRLFKTLVTVATHSKTFYVFVVPASSSLNLKKAAASVNEKAIELIPQKQLLPLTGYVHGGCSPIGMKKPFKTIIDSSAIKFETIYVSAGKIGYQIEINPTTLQTFINANFCDIKN